MADWKEIYQSKLVSVAEAAKEVKSGERCFFAPCSAAPIDLLEALSELKDEHENTFLATALSLFPFSIIMSPDFIGRLDFYTVFYGPMERAFFDEGNVHIDSTNLSQIAEVACDTYNIDGVAMLDVSPPDEDGYMNYGPMGVAVNQDIVDHCRAVVVQVNKFQPAVRGVKNKIHVNDVTLICECDHELPELPQPDVTDTDRQIAEQLLPHINDGDCIQVGIGGLANAIGYSLVGKKNLSLHAEMLTDSMGHLIRSGVLTGDILVALCIGSQDLYYLCGEGKVRFAPISYVNSPVVISELDNYVSINTCLMCDLTGQVASESIGHYQHSSSGGQLDFVMGVALGKGKGKNTKSFICMNSTATLGDGTVITSVIRDLPPGTVVTTPRTYVMYIVTEYGIAHLYLKSIRHRVQEMVKIAHPDFRKGLYQGALEANMIREIDILET